MDVKRCSKCGETKPIEMFAGNGRQKDGLHHCCQECVAAKHEAKMEKGRLYHNPDPDPITQLRREARKTNKQNQDILIGYEPHLDKSALYYNSDLINELRREPVLCCKQCKKCGETKPVEMFAGNEKQKDRLHHTCMMCVDAAY